ncbi:HD domain-containing protein [bacterium]|nr:HD domain-containing protein [bacterium]
MRAVLKITGGKIKGRVFQFDIAQKMLLGSGPEVDVQILDDSLSKKHCQFDWNGKKLTITDLNSKSGTFVNGKKVKEAELQSGSEIQIGQNTMKVEIAHMPIRTIRFFSKDNDVPVEELYIKKYTDEDALGINDLPQVYSEYQKTLEDFNVLFKYGNEINSETELHALLKKVVSIIYDIVKPECVAFLIRSENKNLKPMFVKVNRTLLSEGELCISRNMINQAYTKRVSVIFPDHISGTETKNKKGFKLDGISSAICVPVESRNKLVGLIYIDTTQESFSERDFKILSAFGKQVGVAVDKEQTCERSENISFETIKTLIATFEASDKYIRGHSERVAVYSVKIGEQLGLSEDEIFNLRIASMLHDFGKIGVPDYILYKPGSLNEQEFAKIKIHSVRGADIVENVGISNEIAVAIRHHHENWNGTGYPDGLKGDKIPLMSRIIGVANAFEAMTSDRSYRDRFTESEAISELEKWSGKQFDPAVVTAFIKAYKKGEIKWFDSVIWRYGERKKAR